MERGQEGGGGDEGAYSCKVAASRRSKRCAMAACTRRHAAAASAPRLLRLAAWAVSGAKVEAEAEAEGERRMQQRKGKAVSACGNSRHGTAHCEQTSSAACLGATTM